MAEKSLKYTEARYGEHELQRVGIWEFPVGQRNEQGSDSWLIFIHGGAWRDPCRLLPDFIPSIRAILQSRAIASIRAFASIDYRLSPHPDFPQDASVPPSSLRAARHPDHIADVRAALAHLQAQYGFGNRYVLVGHSAGATLAYQLLMGSAALNEAHGDSSNIILPRALVGISGIYELKDLNERHGGGYASFIAAAFGEDEAMWNRCMPACFEGSFKEALGDRLAVLAWSPQDSLIDEPEVDRMAGKLLKDGVAVKVVKDLIGDHDFVWEDGTQIARLIEEVLDDLAR